MFSKRSTQRVSISRRRTQHRKTSRRQLSAALRSTHRRVGIERLEDRHLLAMDFGDAPDFGVGTGPGDYQTSLVDNGPRHTIDARIFMGRPSEGTPDRLKDDGLRNPHFDLNVTHGSQPEVSVVVTNRTDAPATLHGWIDFNGDGVFDNQTERALATPETIVGFAESKTVQLVFPEIGSSFHGQTQARFRFSTDGAAASPTGLASDGEVEDYVANIFLPHTDEAEMLQYYRVAADDHTNYPNAPFVGYNFKFGDSIAKVGDLDRNGVTDLAVAVPGDNSEGEGTGAVHIFFLESDGSYSKRTIIPLGAAGIGESAPYSGNLLKIAPIGDLNGDGFVDLAVSSGEALSDATSLHVIYLNSVGTAKSVQSIATGVGEPIAHLGDLGNNGTQELVVRNPKVGHTDYFQILSVDSSGAVQKTATISHIASAPLAPDSNDIFGKAITLLGDLDDDGNIEIAVGIQRGGNDDEGIVQILSLNADFEVLHRTHLTSNFIDYSARHDYGFGNSLVAGDLDGDGRFELIVGDPTLRGRSLADSEPTNDVQGAAYVLFLNANGTLEAAQRYALKSNSQHADAKYASAMAFLGDLSVDPSGDGSIEIAISASNDAWSGSVEIVSLNADGSPVARSEIGPFGVHGQNTRHVTSLGDVDGNGYRDMAVAAGNAVQVLFVGPEGRIITTTEIRGDRVGGNGFGTIGSLASAGDLDGDGIDELAVGSTFPDVSRFSPDANGKVQILYLKTDGSLRDFAEIGPTPNLGPDDANFDPANLNFGRAITTVGDLDGNGVPDLAVSQQEYERKRYTGPGALVTDTYDAAIDILFMSSEGSVIDRTSLSGIDAQDLAAIGDLDGDGLLEIAVGRNGFLDVVFLSSEGELRDRKTFDYDLSKLGTDTSAELFGLAVAAPGDLDGDGVADVLVGAPGRTSTDTTQGFCDVRFGSIHRLLLNADGTVKEQLELKTPEGWSYSDVGVDLAVLGDVDGEGGVDFVTAAPPRCDSQGGLIEMSIGVLRRGDFGDAPDSGDGTGPWNYNTHAHDDGPVHIVNDAIYLGTSITADVFANPSNLADGDDDDGLILPGGVLTLTAGQTSQVDVIVTNDTGSDGMLYGWIDLNFDGVFDLSERSEFPVPDKTTEPTVPLSFPFIPAGVAGMTYARFRLSTDGAAAAPTGAAFDGEVEDYLVTIIPPIGSGQTYFDHGDAAIGNSGSIVSTATTPQSQLVDGAFHNIGDVDGNGTNDLAASVLIGGNSPGVEIHLLNPDGTVKRVESTAIPVDLQTHRLGESFTGLGDLNGDGIPDVVIGSPGIGSEAAGRLDVVFLDRDGKSIGSTIIGGDSGNGPSLSEPAGFGISIASIGDIDADGYDDLAVGAAGFEGDGRVFILLMGANGVVDDYQVISGPGDFGSSVVNLGYLNDDHVTDLLIGAPTYSDTLANRRSGAAFVVYLNNNGTEQGRNIISQSTGMPISADDRFGTSVASISDANGDGILDIAVGAPYDNTGGMNRGAVYVLQLARDGSVTDVSKIATGMGGGPEDSADNHGSFGRSIAVMDDSNSNDLPELMVRAGSSDYLVQLADASTAMRSPSHELDSNIFLGSFVDVEKAPNPNDAATGDDVTGFGNDEDGLVDPSQLRNLAVGQNPSVDLYVTNLTGSDAALYGWIDYDMNGEFDGGEQVSLSVPSAAVGKGSLGEIVTLTFPKVPEGFSGTTYARFRFSTDASAAVPTGRALDGEVEDYVVTGIGNGYQNLIPSGSLDPGFGNNGVVRTDSRKPNTDSVVDVVAYPSNGQSLILGSNGSDVTVLRLNMDGVADGTFGNLGVAQHRMWFDGARMSASSMVLDDQNRIIIAGALSYTDGSGRSDFAITRLMPNGDIDTSFGSDGFQFIDFDGRKTGTPDVAIDSTGRIVVGGSAQHIVDRDYDFAVARLTADGVLDSTFSEDGKNHFDLGGTTDISTSLTIDVLDRIVMGGYTNLRSSSQRDLAVIRLTKDGVLDDTFDSDGIQTIDFDNKGDYPGSVAIDSLGRIVVTGRSFQGGESGTDIAVARLTNGGVLDTNFSDDGKHIVDIFSQQEFTYGLAIDGSDRILIAAQTQESGQREDIAVIRLAVSGELDDTFDDDGVQIVDFGNERDFGGFLAIDPVGNILVAGTGTSDFAVARLTNNGDFDSTFSRDGKLTTDIGSPYSNGFASEIVSHQPDGKIVAIGHSSGSSDVLVIRYLDDGQLDLGFGDRGLVRLDTNPFNNSDRAIGVHIDDQGRIILLTNGRQSNLNSGTKENLNIYRLTADGELDASFGTNGLSIHDFNSQSDRPTAMAVDSQGRILISGTSGNAKILTRLTASGTLDSTFGSGQYVELAFHPTDLAVDQNDNIVIVGTVNSDFAAARYLNTGQLDTGFGGDGIQTINIVDANRNSSDVPSAVTIDRFGRIVISGYYYDYSAAQTDVAIAWLNPDGSLDVSFDDDGKLSIDFGGDADSAQSIAVDSSNRVIVGGYTFSPSDGVSDFAVARINSDGTLDEAFGDGGKKIIDLGSTSESIGGVFVDEFDRILLAGSSDSTMTILRLLSNDGAGGEYLASLLSRDYGDAPDTGPGTGPGNYNTSISDSGPSHQIDQDIFIGKFVDGEFTANPGSQANSDDVTGDLFHGELADDEDAFGSLTFIGGTSPTVTVVVTNRTAKPAMLYGWIDSNGDGTFDLSAQHSVNPDPESTTVELDFPMVPVGFNGTTYARFRLSTDIQAASVPTGFASDGEVEDHIVSIRSSLLTIGNVSKVEGAVGPTPFVFTVTRSGSLVGEVSVDYQTVDGTATVDNSDYLPVADTLTFLDGESTKTITVIAQGDTYAETNETFVVRLSGVTGNAAITRSEGIGTILDTGGFVIHGVDSVDSSGYSVSSAGDVNSDGIDDLVIGAPYADGIDNSRSNVGESYVVFGRHAEDPFTTSVDLSSLDGSNGFVIHGIDSSGSSGFSVSGAGDVNNDGIVDLVIGAPNANGQVGESYVIFGRKAVAPFTASVDLSSLDGSNGFVIHGIDSNDRSGISVSGAGDINNDGTDDLIIGAYIAGSAGNGQSGAGESYVIFGRNAEDPFGASVDLSSLDGSNGFVIHGVDSGDSSGISVSGAGDVNGDGISDLVIGAFLANGSGNGQSNAGESYVIFGRDAEDPFAASIDLSLLDGSNGFVIHGIDSDDSSGISVSGAGDINNDGIDDLIIGAYYADGAGNGQSAAGESYVIFGRNAEVPFAASVSLSSLNGSSGFAIHGIDSSDHSGISVSRAGDINNDGIDDLIIGAYSANGSGNGQSDAGESYVIFGRDEEHPFAASVELNSLDGSNGFVIYGFDSGDFSGYSVSGAGDVNNDGIDDLIIGAYYADGQAGQSYVVFGRDGVNPFGASLDLSSLSAGLKDWVKEATDEKEPILTIASDPEKLTSTLQAITQLENLNVGETLEISINLTAGVYSGETIKLPAGITVRINGSNGPTWVGASPALTLESGNLIVEGFTFTNATDAPTILVQGGSLTLRNSRIEETTTADRPAIQVTGGKVDLGTADDPGGNTIIIHGDGDLIDNAGPHSLSAIGNTFQIDEVPIVSEFEIEAEITDHLERQDAGLVSYLADNVFDSLVAGERDLDLLSLVADLELTDPTFVITEAVNGEAEILSDDHTVRFVAAELGSASFRYSVRVDDVEVATRIAHFDVTNLPPVVAVELSELTVDQGDVASNTITFSDSVGDVVSLSASIGTVTQADDGSGTWSWSFNTNDTTDESQTVTITATDSFGITSRTTFSLNVNLAADPLSVSGVTVNDGALQRSNTTQLAIQFDRDFDAQSMIDSGQILSAISLHTGAGFSTNVALTADQFRWDMATSRLLIDLTAGGTQSILADGRYELRIHDTIDASFVDSDGTDDGVYRYHFHQLSGDFDGDAIVGISDRATWFDRTKVQFGARAGMAGYDSAFDFDGDGIISTRDYYVWLRSCVGKQLD
ncbi:GEVED domain-containing protein [Novipirellula galeiformis]|nr:GEVED domain-containing protein [Novipirellula galeiformis]